MSDILQDGGSPDFINYTTKNGRKFYIQECKRLEQQMKENDEMQRENNIQIMKLREKRMSTRSFVKQTMGIDIYENVKQGGQGQ